MYSPGQALRDQEGEAPIFQDNQHLKIVRLSALRTGRIYPPGNIPGILSVGGTRWRTCLRHCATCLKVAGSIPDCVIGIFHSHNPSGRTMVLGYNQALTEMNTMNISWEVEATGA